MKLEKKLNIKLDNVIINNINVNDYVTKDEYNSKVEELNKNIEDLKNDIIDWSELGYNQQPVVLTDAINYAKEIMKNWNPNVSEVSFMGDKNLIYFPVVDWSKISYVGYAFYDCIKLQHVGHINNNKMNPSFNYTFSNCNSLHTIDLLELDYAVIDYTTFASTNNVVNLTCTNLGKIFYSTVFQFGNLQNWSYETMINSLLNYSYDRSKQTDIVTIELHSDAKARLTDADIAAITAKGYTIV